MANCERLTIANRVMKCALIPGFPVKWVRRLRAYMTQKDVQVMEYGPPI